MLGVIEIMKFLIIFCQKQNNRLVKKKLAVAS